MYDVITIGGASRDIVVRTNAGKLIATDNDPLATKLLGFPYGAKVPVLRADDNFGGGGCNVAVGLAKLGLSVSSRINLGRDLDGLNIQKNLAAAKVSPKLISWDLKEKTDLSIVVIDENGGGDHIVFVDKNASNNLTLRGKRIKSRWFYVSAATGDWQNLWKEIIAAAKKDQIKIAFNPGMAQLACGYSGLKEILAAVEILILSLDEAIELVSSYDNNFSRAADNLAACLASFGPKVVVITEGAKGASAYDGKVLRFKRAVKVENVADTTGAGDAFSAAFLGAIVLGYNLETALAWGVKNGAAVISEYGAQNGLLTRKEIEEA